MDGKNILAGLLNTMFGKYGSELLAASCKKDLLPKTNHD